MIEQALEPIGVGNAVASERAKSVLLPSEAEEHLASHRPDVPAAERARSKRAARGGRDRGQAGARRRGAGYELTRLQAEYGRAACANPEGRRPSMRGFKIAHGELGQALRAAMKRVAALKAKRAATPGRVPLHEAVENQVVKLAPERKHRTSLLKMVAYQAESDLLRLVAPHYRRTEDEGRTLIQTALTSAADLEVTDRELRVVIAPLSSAHRTRAIAALCEDFNRAPTAFPGTRLRLRFSVGGPR